MIAINSTFSSPDADADSDFDLLLDQFLAFRNKKIAWPILVGTGEMMIQKQSTRSL
ncbi:Uncharacterised protein [uncultured archaeon]|nr:Uncharacterised protein [uncultured archaeon]